jgi:septal ring factor EnvC (AmiA/AmiB activator)
MADLDVIFKTLQQRIAQQRRELARLNRLVADQRAAMAADGVNYAAAERWAVIERDQLKERTERGSEITRSDVGSCACCDATRAAGG